MTEGRSKNKVVYMDDDDGDDDGDMVIHVPMRSRLREPAKPILNDRSKRDVAQRAAAKRVKYRDDVSIGEEDDDEPLPQSPVKKKRTQVIGDDEDDDDEENDESQDDEEGEESARAAAHNTSRSSRRLAGEAALFDADDLLELVDAPKTKGLTKKSHDEDHARKNARRREQERRRKDDVKVSCVIYQFHEQRQTIERLLRKETSRRLLDAQAQTKRRNRTIGSTVGLHMTVDKTLMILPENSWHWRQESDSVRRDVPVCAVCAQNPSKYAVSNNGKRVCSMRCYSSALS